MKRIAKSPTRTRSSRTAARSTAARRTRATAPGARAARPARTHRSSLAFVATLEEKGPTGLWPHVFLPAKASEFLGRRGAVNIVFSANGAKFRRTAKPDGDGGHYVLFNADMRERSGVEPGDRFRAAIEIDRAPRTPELAHDVLQSLRDDRRAKAAFTALPPSHRRSLVEFIDEAKRPETRVRRIQQALRMMVVWAAARPGSKR